jgi:hypothetical protein
MRNWWMRVGGERCQYEWYDEKRGWQQCRNTAKHVHHIIPESQQLANGEDPEHSMGMPLCQSHHVRNKGEEEHSKGFGFHPDIAGAYDKYGEWKQQAQHMKSISERRSIDYGTSPFAEVQHDHHEKAERGERFWGGTPEIDDFYVDKMETMGTRYLAEHPEDPKPKTKQHVKTEIIKRKHWYNIF